MFKTSHFRAGLFLASASIISMASTAMAQETSSAKKDSPRVEDTIIVTGTRQAQRTAFGSLAPIDVISGDAISNGASEDLLDTLAQNVPSFKVQRLPMADGQVFVRPATLRGLSPDQTLVLVNGKRRHRSALLGGNGAQSADLATIPSSAIKRIEVLRDGASAQYGSDAIAGVINIILKDDAGFGGFAQGSQYYEGDGNAYRLGGRAGFDLADNGTLVLSGEYFDNEITSRSRQRPDAIEFQEANPDVDVPNPVQNWGQPERNGYRFTLNSDYDFSTALSGYLFATYGGGEGLSDFNWRNPTSGIFNTSTIYPDFNLLDIYPAGFSPDFGQEDTDLSVTTGLKGAVANDALSWEFSVGYGSNEIEYNISNTINASLGPNSPTSFYIGSLKQDELNVNADFVYVVDFGLADNANIAFGAERRMETYTISPGEEASYLVGPAAAEGLASGSNGFFGFSESQSGEFEQESYAAYLDVELPFTDKFTLGTAARFEDFSEFGNSLTGKISGRYEFTSELALRATASTGFRAPTPGQLFSERNSSGLDTTTLEVFTNGRYSPVGAVAAIINERADVDIKPLDAEESINFTAGLAYQSASGITASIDLYQIDIENRFGTSAGYSLTDEERAQLVALNVTGAETISRVQFYQNDFDTTSKGVDLVLGYKTGELSLLAAYNYNKTEVTGGSLEANSTQKTVFEERLPQHSANFSADYTLGAFVLGSKLRYYGSWTDSSGNSDGDIFQEFGGQAFLDVSAKWNINDTMSFTVGADNVLDTYPDEATFQANRGLIYSRNAPYDTDGGLYYARFNFDF
ncbi:TonB-dependent receptor plug domain-containing protein [Hirschia baltica]|uniref:TonB-dependent receptor n=1 Tax=Hirschia baltica (strain ATCC 49814 / DSM 5838 / IFAM 1418) TaxID=582402 RepID=C6XQ82_HIRBI|nr:TonB-dependent receptor [Hirschia baltica]ACT60381.1 TonB-dependent receptor [Hirschia baltica ATCC 49814]